MRNAEMRQVRSILESKGFKVTSRWINGEHEVLEGQDHNLNERFAREDWEDLNNANLMIYFVPNGNENRGRGGRHVEFGLALAWNIQIFVIGKKENVFHWMSQVRHFDDLNQILEVIKPNG
jgi:hypothetical protein